MGEGETTQY
jgi:hypothetical protein